MFWGDCPPLAFARTPDSKGALRSPRFRPLLIVGAALIAAKQRTLRKTRFNQKGRGVFCGIGVCFDCLVVIDGASTDETLNVLHKCLDKDAVLISESDDGMYHAINKGIALCSGDIDGSSDMDSRP